MKSIMVYSIIYLMLIIFSIIILTPFVYILLVSFGQDVVGPSAVIPSRLTLENYYKLFQGTMFLDWMKNSLIISLSTVVIAVFLVSVSVYVFSRLKFYGKTYLFNFFLLIQIFPLTLSMVSIFHIFVRLGLLNRLPALILVNSTLASAGLILLAKGYFDSIPYELDEAAMIDGASIYQILFKIILPLARPMIALVAIQSFVIAYNEYVIASVIMSEGLDNLPLAVGLQSMIVGQFSQNWSLYCAGAIIGSLPMLILFYILQSYFISGLTEGSVKI